MISGNTGPLNDFSATVVTTVDTLNILDAPAITAALFLSSLMFILDVAKAIWPSKSISTSAWLSGVNNSGEAFWAFAENDERRTMRIVIIFAIDFFMI